MQSTKWVHEALWVPKVIYWPWSKFIRIWIILNFFSSITADFNMCIICTLVKPNHCGRHLGKINGHKFTYINVWRCTFWWISMFLTEKPWVKLLNVKLQYLPGLQRNKYFGNGQCNPVTDRTTCCHMSLFQTYKFAMHLRTSRSDVTDYASV